MSLTDSDKSEPSDKKSDNDSSPSSPDDKTERSSGSPPDDQMMERSDGSQSVAVSPESDSLSSNNIRISDVGIYSLCGLTSILFHQLYPEESNR